MGVRHRRRRRLRLRLRPRPRPRLRDRDRDRAWFNLALGDHQLAAELEDRVHGADEPG